MVQQLAMLNSQVGYDAVEISTACLKPRPGCTGANGFRTQKDKHLGKRHGEMGGENWGCAPHGKRGAIMPMGNGGVLPNLNSSFDGKKDDKASGEWIEMDFGRFSEKPRSGPHNPGLLLLFVLRGGAL